MYSLGEKLLNASHELVVLLFEVGAEDVEPGAGFATVEIEVAQCDGHWYPDQDCAYDKQ